jgi:glycosyltransferase involved in cell wall biosynthesis
MVLSDSPRISVVMCTYQGAEFVAEQVASILSQTVPAHELVVGDDASRDATLAIVRDLVDEHHRSGGAPLELRILTRDPAEHPEPFGVAGNFARALAAATGDVVVLSDQDDRWVPERIAVSLAALASHPDAGLMHADARLVDAGGEPLGVTLFEALGVGEGELAEIDAGRGFDALLRRNLVTGATAAATRELVQAALPIPDGWIHDEWMAVVAGALGRTVVVRESVVDYRQHGRNQIGARKLDWSTRVARLREPRTQRNERLVRRARSLVARLEEFGDRIPAGRLAAAREKLAHEQARERLPAVRPARLVPVLREWRTGRYRAFGLGAQDVLRDLVQPV